MATFFQSDRGKQLQGQQAEIPLWMIDQWKRIMGMGNQAQPHADFLRDFAVDQGIDRYAAGFPDPWQVRQTGQDIFPYQGALDARAGRLGQIQDMWGNVRGAGETFGDLSGWIDQYGANVGRTADQSRDEIDNATRRMLQQQGFAHGDIMGNISDVFGGARGQTQGLYGGLLDETDKTYGELTGSGRSTYGDLIGSGGETYDEMRDVVERTAPSGEYAAARTARSFAPMMRAAMQRLRASGIDPNSIEAQSALRGVEAERSRAMDEQMAGGAERYADRMSRMLTGEQGMRERLGLGQQDMLERLGLGRLGFGSQLAREGGAIDRDLLLGSGQEFRNQIRENTGIGRGLEQDRFGLSLGNINRTFDRSADYLNQRQQAEMLRRGMDLEDFGIQGNLLRELNNEDLLGLDLSQRQYGLGQQQTLLDQQKRMQEMLNLQGLGQQEINNAMNWNQLGIGMYNPMYQSLGQGRETQQGWGNSLIGAVAGTGLNFLTGGLNFKNPFGGGPTPEWSTGGG
jgi:hypothetical protein